MTNNLLAFIVSGTLRSAFDEPVRLERVNTQFGSPSAPLAIHEIDGKACAVLFRHGVDSHIAAHKVNYRANIWALHSIGVTHLAAYATTGSVDPDLRIGAYMVPDQIIDYTHSRKGSFGIPGVAEHFDFSFPFTSPMRTAVLEAANEADLAPIDGGTYACTQGPRYETAAEIAKYGRDGCSIVGMTLMPEAALARQLGLEYAALAFVMNPGAGIDGKAVDIPGSLKYTDAALLSLKAFNKALIKRIP
ncbi:MAG: S-methyl-5'-thioinosine phosphorylase [Gammaproteobacteria bacterium]|nr:S-methyl-5'-thioinosine phosphorylase [Gammaproteobacteria bacterium]